MSLFGFSPLQSRSCNLKAITWSTEIRALGHQEEQQEVVWFLNSVCINHKIFSPTVLLCERVLGYVTYLMNKAGWFHSQQFSLHSHSQQHPNNRQKKRTCLKSCTVHLARQWLRQNHKDCSPTASRVLPRALCDCMAALHFTVGLSDIQLLMLPSCAYDYRCSCACLQVIITRRSQVSDSTITTHLSAGERKWCFHGGSWGSIFISLNKIPNFGSCLKSPSTCCVKSFGYAT